MLPEALILHLDCFQGFLLKAASEALKVMPPLTCRRGSCQSRTLVINYLDFFFFKTYYLCLGSAIEL